MNPVLSHIIANVLATELFAALGPRPEGLESSNNLDVFPIPPFRMTLMAGRSAQTRRGSQEASYLLRTPELSRRSLSQDDTPRPSGVLQGANPGQNVNAVNELGNASTSQNPSEQQPTKRLGLFGEKLLSANSGSSSSTTRGAPIAPTLLPTRSHSRAESALPFISRELSASPTPGMAASSGQMAKGHSSPSKVS